MDNKRNYSLIRFAPIGVMLAAWVPQGLYRFLAYNSPFASVATAVYGLVAIAIVCYVCGALVGRRVDREYLLLSLNRLPHVIQQIPNSLPTAFYKKFRLFIVALALAFFLNAFLLQVLNGVDMAALRDDALNEWSEGGLFVKLMAVGVNGLACLLLLCISLEHRSSGKTNLSLVLLFVCVCLAAYARTLLLIGLFILMLRMIATHKAPLRLVIKLLSGFVFLFLLLAFFGKDNSANENGVIDILMGHAEVYFFGGVSGLNNYFMNGEPHYNSTLSVPRFVQGIIPIFGQPPPQYFDFVETPLPLNVFTAIYPPFHDFGVVGVIILFFIYGIATATACRKFAASDSYVWQVVAGFLLYATAMSIFDDQFIRALPVFLIFISAAMLFRKLQSVLETQSGVN